MKKKENDAQLKTQPTDRLMMTSTGATIMKCYQCCEEIPLTMEYLNKISGGLFASQESPVTI